MNGWDFACPDWKERIRTGKSLIPVLPLDAEMAETGVRVFNKLRLPDVPGQPFLGEAGGEWQRDIVRAAFGSLVDGVRMVPEILCLVPKKNSKTTGGAAFSLTWLLTNQRPRAEGIYIGPTQEVAEVAFNQAVGMIEADEYLTKRFHVAHHTKTIRDRRNKSVLKVKTFDMKVVTGSKPAFVLMDELHLMSTMSSATRIIGQVRGGMLPNPEAMLIIITTQSDEPPAGAFAAELQYARNVRDGKITQSRLLPILYEFPPEMQASGDWEKPEYWPMVLPNLDRSITLDRLIADYRVAVEKGEEERRRWASQHLNVEIGLALNSDRWVGAEYWEDAADESISLQAIMNRCDVAVVGIDGGGLDDLLALTVIGRCRTTKDWLSWSHAWAHQDVLKRKIIAERLRDFERDGDLTICTHPTQDVRELCDIVQELADRKVLPEKNAVGVDPQGIAAIVDELVNRGITDEQIIGIPQGFRLSGAIWGMERKLKDGTFWHADQRMLDWCVGNARVEQRGNAVLITKQAAGKAKIDPLVSNFNATVLMSRNPAAIGASYTAEHGVMFV